MAIKKLKQLKSGVSGDYWKVIAVYYDRIAGKLNCQIALFLDQDHKEQHLGVIKQYSFLISKLEGQGDLNALAYVKIKEQAARLVPVFGAIPERDAEGKLKLGEDGKPLPLPKKPYDPDIAGGEDV